MIVTTDPISAVPMIGMERSAWLSVNLIASDFTTSGMSPEYASFVYNFPTEMDGSDVETYLSSVGKACRELGVSIVAGHTGTYPGAGFSVIGSGTMFGFASKGGYLDPSMSRENDAILMTKGAGLEAAAYLALTFPKMTKARVGVSSTRKAAKLVHQCSTVQDALSARRAGLGRDGITSMHDATEGGLLGGLDEMAFASGKAFVVDLEKVAIPAEAAAVCSAYGLDPLTTLSEGTLLITCNPGIEEEIRELMTEDGIPTFAIGSVRKGAGLWLSRRGRKRWKFMADEDRYWKTYVNGVKAGWR